MQLRLIIDLIKKRETVLRVMCFSYVIMMTVSYMKEQKKYAFSLTPRCVDGANTSFVAAFLKFSEYPCAIKLGESLL